MKEILLTLITSISFIYNDDICKNNPWVNGHYTTTQTGSYIWICNTKEFHSDPHRVILHELGHFYYYEHISEENKEIFKKLHSESLNKTWILKNRWYVSFQASKNIDEDFAESFAYAYLWRAKGNKKVIFIKNILWEKLKP